MDGDERQAVESEPEAAPPSPRTTLLAVGAGLVATYAAITWLWPLVLTLLVGGVVYYLLTPVVGLLERRVPRALGALAAYAAFVGVLLTALLLLVPRAYGQLEALGRDLPRYGEQLEQRLSDLSLIGDDADPLLRDALDALVARADGVALDAVNAALSAFGGLVVWVFAILLGLVLGLYLLLGAPALAAALPTWFPPGQRRRWVRFGRQVSGVLAGYLRARLIASIFVGTSYGAAFALLGVDNALLLGVVGGFLNVVPIVGPFLAAVPALVIAAFEGIDLVIAVALVMVVAQQIESSILNPQVEGRYVRLSPAAVVVVAAAGSAIAGVAGLLLAVPIAASARAALDVFYRDGWRSPAAAHQD